jgi:V/A-type H+-transporting ATPase subunit F
MGMELAIVGPELFALGFRLAGVRKTYVAETDEELETSVRKALADDQVGILVMPTDDLQRLDPNLRRRLEESIQPTLVSIGLHEDTALREKLKQAIGVDVWN